MITCYVDESSRVCLQPIRGVDGSDYINADFVHVSWLIHLYSFVDNNNNNNNNNTCLTALSGTTQVSRYQKGKTDLDFIEARNSEWQWH